MSNHKLRLRVIFGFALAMLALFAGWVSPVSANGCSVAAGTPSPSVTQRTIAAPIVLEGTVSAVAGNDLLAVATVQVQQYIKGSGPSLVYISGYHKLWTLYECADWVEVGAHAIFYAQRNPASGRLQTFLISPWPSTIPADSVYIREAIAAADQSPVTPLPETEIAPIMPTLLPTQVVATSQAATAAQARTNSVLAILLLAIAVLAGTTAIILIVRVKNM